MGRATASKETVRERLATRKSTHARFLGEMFEPAWREAQIAGVDPVLVVALAVKETGGGHFAKPSGLPGAVKPGFFNPGGVKVRYQEMFPEWGADSPLLDDKPLAHTMRANWYDGFRVVAQHLRAYAGAELPEDQIVDPRWYIVWSMNKPIDDVEGLNGRWAGPTYGTDLVKLCRELGSSA